MQNRNSFNSKKLSEIIESSSHCPKTHTIAFKRCLTSFSIRAFILKRQIPFVKVQTFILTALNVAFVMHHYFGTNH